MFVQGQPEGGAGVQQFEFISPTGGAWQLHDSPGSSASWDTPFDGCCMAPAFYAAPSPSPSPSPSIAPTVTPSASVSPSVSPSLSVSPVYALNSCAPGFTLNIAANRCYAVVGIGAGGVSWTDAQARCRALGAGFASLAAIRNAAQMTAVNTGRCNGLVPATGTNGQELFWWFGLNDGASDCSALGFLLTLVALPPLVACVGRIC